MVPRKRVCEEIKVRDGNLQFVLVLGDVERFDFMKASRIICPVLLIVTGLTCLFSWLTIPQSASQARIKIENDFTDISSLSGHASASFSSYDPYFIHENYFRQILLPPSKPK
jgi:hypothetical protein